MKLLLLILPLFISLSHAENFEVHSIIKRAAVEDAWIIKFNDGRVGFWNQEEDPNIQPEKLSGSIIQAKLSEESVLSDIVIVGFSIGLAEPESNKRKIEILPNLPYTPTIYQTYDFATDVLQSMRRNWSHSSQCYDRSHIWAFEEFNWGRRYLQKAFLFFSDSYIERYNFKWWFHTAPYALIRMNGFVNERIMDPAFTQYPLKEKLWTDIFMKNKVVCKAIGKYSEYSAHPGEDDCYVMKTSVYFWQPKDLEALERSGIEKKKFIDWEVRHAYENGFGIYQ
jgi:hypothetical protein